MFTSISGSLKKYADFSGKATRKEFWLFVLFLYITSFVTGFIDGLAGTDFIANIAILALLLPYIAVAARRMHDVGKSGWFMLVPIYNVILALTPSATTEETKSEG
jgi:uncharacterized membrane protein YhaH (DUF805 family)